MCELTLTPSGMSSRKSGEIAQTFEKGAYYNQCDRETRIEERPLTVSIAAKTN
jgi:hypothetical protein